MFTFDVRETVAAIARLRQALQAEQPDQLRTIGRQILDRGHADVRIKAAGGTGSDGIRWPPLKAARRKGGTGITDRAIRPGRLQDPRFDVLDIRGDEVTAGFGASFASRFDERRQLLPETLPPAWEQDAYDFLQSRLDALTKGIS